MCEWSGPYVIEVVLFSNTYKVRDQKTKTSQIVHAMRIQLLANPANADVLFEEISESDWDKIKEIESSEDSISLDLIRKACIRVPLQ